MNRRILIIATCATLGHAAAARPQSAVDGFNPGANSVVMTSALQSDGKILIGGFFTLVGGGGTGSMSRGGIARLNIDGSVDTNFAVGSFGNVYALAVQSDGKVLVAGNFSGIY